MIERFLEYLRCERGFSAMTVDSYGRDLRAFAAHLNTLEDGLSPLDADADMIRGWMEAMMDDGKSPATVNRRLSALHTFYRYAMLTNLVEKDPSHIVSGPKKPKPLPKFMREDDMDALLDGEGMWSDSFTDVRDHAIVATFYETGMRLSELKGMNDSDVDFASSRLKVTGKRNKQRYIPFGEELGQLLHGYIAARRHDIGPDAEALFVTVKGRRMNSDQVRYVVRKALARVSTARKRSPHVLRHTFATAMLNHGACIESVKLILGHESLETTQLYTHTTFEQLKRDYKKALKRA